MLFQPPALGRLYALSEGVLLGRAVYSRGLSVGKYRLS